MLDARDLPYGRPGLTDALEGMAALPIRLPFLGAVDWLAQAPGRVIVGRSGIAYRIADGALTAEAPMGWPDGPPLALADLRGAWELREG